MIDEQACWKQAAGKIARPTLDYKYSSILKSNLFSTPPSVHLCAHCFSPLYA
jgi:hypothetical protein